MNKQNPFENISERLKKTEAEVGEENKKRMGPIISGIIRELENLSSMRATNVPKGIIRDIRNSLDNIRSVPYQVMRDFGEAEIKARMEKMNSKQADVFKNLWDNFANEVFGKISFEGQSPLEKAEQAPRGESRMSQMDALANFIVNEAIVHEGNAEIKQVDIEKTAKDIGFDLSSIAGQAEGRLGGSAKIFKSRLLDRIDSELEKAETTGRINSTVRAKYLGSIQKSLNKIL